MTSAVLSAAIIFLVTIFIVPTNVITIGAPNGGGPVFTLSGFQKEKIILLMGVDVNYANKDKSNYDGTRTDTMMLVRLSPGKRTISVVSIPRDSKVYLADNRGIDKINAAHAIGGPEMAVQTVQDSFGIPIDSYMVVNFQGVREVVDALGGVRVFVEKPMHYRDRTAKLNINFDPGYHDLSGKQAEEFLRFRHDAMADIGRIRRQQLFISAMSEKLRSPWIITKIPSLVNLGNKYVHTDMAFDDMMRIASFVKDVDTKSIRVATLPGHPSGGGISYWVIDPEPAQEVLDRMILDNPSVGLASVDANNPLKVGILFAPNARERADKLATALEAKNFKVTCRSRQAHNTTQIIEHTNRVNDAHTQRLRAADKGLEGARLIFAPVGTTFENNTCGYNEDYTVIIGEDNKS